MTRTKYPMKKGERIMYATIGEGGGIYAFSKTASEARDIRDEFYCIGKARVKKYLVKFEEI